MQYSEGVLFDNRYLLKEFKGSGSFGEVWLAQDTVSDLELAIKIYIAMDDQGLAEFKKEYQIAFDLNHTNLLHATSLEICKEDKRPYLVMTYCPNGSVFKLVGSISEQQMWLFIRDVASGLAYLHEQHPPIIHQDIKPDNILIDKNGNYVITDFGISKQARNTLRRSSVVKSNSTGSVSYMAPERFSKQSNPIKASDIWSLGATIYELAVGDVPFNGLGGSLQRHGADIPDLPTEFSHDLNMVMQRCLQQETWDRPTAEMLAEYAAKKVKGQVPTPFWTEAEPVAPAPAPVSAPTPASASKQPRASKPQHKDNSWLVWALIVLSGLVLGAVIGWLL